MNSTLTVPKFATEAEEADWWYDNRHLVEAAFTKAFDDGTVRRGTLKQLAREADQKRLAGTEVSLNDKDVAKARAAAERHGMSFESFVRLLVHEGLEREETRSAS